jgi:SdrD B-like domain
MRGSRVVLALAMTLIAVRVTNAQDTTQASIADDKKCLERPRGSPSDTGLANRADPTLQGNKDCVPPVLGHATISGNVFFDLDQNGIFGPDEVGLSSWQVVLSGPVSQTVQTDVNGAYSFTGLTAGTYTVCVSQLPGWNQIPPAGGATTTCPIGIGYLIDFKAQVADMTFTRDFGYVSQ